MRIPGALVVTILIIAFLPPCFAVTGSVLVNYQATSNKSGITSIGKSLGNTPAFNPNKASFLTMAKQSDLLYINTHVCTPKDRPDLNGKLLLGPDWKSNPAHVVGAEEVSSLYAEGRSPRLVVLAGCEGAQFGWNNAFGGATVITFKENIRGVACDIYFQYVLDYWKNNDVTLAAALKYADTAWQQDPDIKMLSRDIYGVGKLTSVMEITGNREIKYSSIGGESPLHGYWKFVDSSVEDPYVILIEGSDQNLTGRIVKSPEKGFGYVIGSNMFEGGKLEKDSYQIQWMQYPDESHRHKLVPTTTPGSLTMRPDGEAFMISGRNRMYGFEYKGDKDHPSATRKEAWLEEFGPEEFHYSFIRIAEP